MVSGGSSQAILSETGDGARAESARRPRPAEPDHHGPRGRMDAKRQLMIAEIPRLRRFARALAGDPALADDLVQDCLERALGRLHQWRDGTSMRGWLLTILRNIYFNQRRDAARRPPTDDIDVGPDGAGAAPPAQDGRIAARDLARHLTTLPDQQREVILLIGLEDLSYKETADILGVPVGTVMSRLARGREALRKAMDNGGNGQPDIRRVK